MQIIFQPSDYNTHNYSHNRLSSPVIVLLLLAAAFGVRLYHIDRPPMDFSAIRQYQNAHIIRGLYYEANDEIPEAKREIAKLNMERMGLVMEPRILENISLAGYRITGGERLWIPRVLSAIFWVAGGLFVYLIAKRFFSPGTSLFSTVFYLFLPYGISSSRSIQPDSLMVMMTLFSLDRILKYDENPSGVNLFIAAIVTAAAVLIKPYCIFIIFGAFFSLAIIQKGFRKACFSRDTLVFILLIILPSVAFYAYRLLANIGFLGVHAQGSFLPHLLAYPSFWKGWLEMIGDVVGYFAFFSAALGLFIIGKGKPRALLLGLWAGYLLLGLSATFQIHTHSYYHMPFIPIVALSLGPVADMVVSRRNVPVFRRTGIFILMIFLIATVTGFSLNIHKAHSGKFFSDYKNSLRTVSAVVGINPEFRKLLNDDFGKEVGTAKEIGELVGHSSKTLFLTPDFGRVIAYHGEFSGLPWPTSTALYGRRLRGARVPNIKDDFTPAYVTILYQGNFIRYSPDFFIITAFDEFDVQADLKDHLYNKYPILAQTDDYLIFDLRKMSELNN